jgi:F0F1-type ATP synthase assembly protein I
MDRLASDASDRARAHAALQNSVQRAEPRIVASYALVGAILLFGGAGYLVDLWARSSPWGIVGGLVAGLLLGFANLIASLRR